MGKELHAGWSGVELSGESELWVELSGESVLGEASQYK